MPKSASVKFTEDTTSLKNSIVTDYGLSIDCSRPQSMNATRAVCARSEVTRPSVQPLGQNGAAKRSGRPISFIDPVHNGSRWYQPTLRNQLILAVSQMISFVLSSCFLMVVVAWAMLADLSAHLPRILRPVKPATFPWDDPKRLKNEKCVKDVRYYAQDAGEGYDILDEEVETDDGYYLRCGLLSPHLVLYLTASCVRCRVHRVVNPRHKHQANGKGMYLIPFYLLLLD